LTAKPISLTGVSRLRAISTDQRLQRPRCRACGGPRTSPPPRPCGDETGIQRLRRLPSPPRAQRVAGRGSGVGGCFNTAQREYESEWRDPPTPDPSPPLRGGRGGSSSGSRQFHQRRQESASVLPAPVGRNQERGAIVAGLCEQRQLMLARRPAAACEPAAKAVRSSSAVSSGGAGKMRGGTAQDLCRCGGFVEASESPRTQ